jgi:hypothetical protein
MDVRQLRFSPSVPAPHIAARRINAATRVPLRAGFPAASIGAAGAGGRDMSQYDPGSTTVVAAGRRAIGAGCTERSGVLRVAVARKPFGRKPAEREPVAPGAGERWSGSRRRPGPAAGPSTRSRTSISPASEVAGGRGERRPVGAGEVERVVFRSVLSISPPHVSNRSRGRCCGQGET